MQKEVHRALVVRAMRVGCSVTAILSRRRSSLRSAIFGTSSEVLSRGFLHTVVSFSWAIVGSFHPGSRGDTSPHTGFEINTDPGAPRRRSAGHRSSARCAFGDRGFDWNYVDFLLFGVTTEEIRWLQPRVVVPRVTPPGDASTFVGRDANVVRETVIATPRLSCLRARRPVDLCGPPPSLGSCVRRVRGIPCRPSEVLDAGVFLWSSARTGLRRFFFIESRAEVHEACGS